MNLKILALSILTAAFAFAGEADAKPSVADSIFDKVLADNTKEATKAYDAYVAGRCCQCQGA